jgi:hypothetical protein
MLGMRMLAQTASILAVIAMCSRAMANESVTTSTNMAHVDPFASATAVLRLPLDPTFYERPRVRVAENLHMRQLLLVLQQLENDQFVRQYRRTASGEMLPFRTVSVMPMGEQKFGVQVSCGIQLLEQKGYSFGTIQYGRRTLLPGEGDLEERPFSIFNPNNIRLKAEFP